MSASRAGPLTRVLLAQVLRKPAAPSASVLIPTEEHHSGQAARLVAEEKTPTVEAARRCGGAAAPLTERVLSCFRRRGSRRCFGHVGRVREDPRRRALCHEAGL